MDSQLTMKTLKFTSLGNLYIYSNQCTMKMCLEHRYSQYRFFKCAISSKYMCLIFHIFCCCKMIGVVDKKFYEINVMYIIIGLHT